MTHTILIERQGTKILLWVDNELIREWKKNTHMSSAPLALARDIEKAFAVAHVACVIESEELTDEGIL